MTLLPARSLFWRAFLTFWGAMAVILVCGMVLTASVAWYRFNSLDGLNPGNLTRDAAQVARTQGEGGLARWVRAMDDNYSALKIYIMDAEDRDILDRRLPTRLHDWLVAYRAGPDRATQSDYAPADPAGERVSWWEPQTLMLPDGSEMLMLFLPFDSSRWEVLALSPVALALLLFALAVTAPFCWALTRHITAPLGQLRQATHALSAGRLDTHTPAKLATRKDELGLLARDFDAMAVRLKALVDTREQLLHNVAHELRSPLARLRLASELARQSEWAGVQGDAIILRVAVKTLAESESRVRLQTVLCEHFGQGIRLDVQVGVTGDATAYAVAQAESAARQLAAENAVADDPFVQALLADFGGHVVPGSIRHVDSSAAA